MLAESAMAIIREQLIFAPGWVFECEDFTHRFENCIKITVTYPAVQTDRQDSVTGYLHKIDTHASFVVMAGNCEDQTDLMRCLMVDVIMPIMQHEAREMLRLRPTFWAPFHPHRLDGMHRWGEPDADLKFGLV